FMICLSALIIFTLFYCDPSGNGETDPPPDNPVPTLTSPQSKVAHMPSFTLTATGTNFIASSKIVFDGVEIPTTYVSATEVTCQVEPDDIVVIATNPANGANLSGPLNANVPVLIRNPAPGGGDSNSKNFTIRDKHNFSAPILISGTLKDSLYPDIAVDSNGNVNVAWFDWPYLGNCDIYYRRSTDFGATWDTIVNISNSTNDSKAPSIAVDDTGNINVAWYDDYSSYVHEIKFKRSTDSGATWGSTVTVSNYTGYARRPDIALDSSGNLNLVWTGGNPGDYEIYFSRSTDNGATWSSFVNISNSSGLSQSPVIAVDSSGNLNTAWYDNSPGNYEIYFSRSTDNGTTWSTPVNVSNTTATSYAPAIVVDTNGNLCIAWYDKKTNTWQVYFSRSTNNGTTWSTMQNVSNASVACSHPGIAVDSAVNINMVWSKNTWYNEPIIFGRSIDNGANWSTPLDITNNPMSTMNPEISLDSNGNIYVVWDDDGGPDNKFIYFTGSAH
ncbi:sialidase family protein, partial [Acidobacteriota bacterium]